MYVTRKKKNGFLVCIPVVCPHTKKRAYIHKLQISSTKGSKGMGSICCCASFQAQRKVVDCLNQYVKANMLHL